MRLNVEEREATLKGQRVVQQKRLAAEIAKERETRLEGQRAAQQERLAAEPAEEKEARLEGQRADQQKSLVAETCLYAACLYLDLTHSVYFLCDILCLRFSCILMTLATAPRSACRSGSPHNVVHSSSY